MGSDRCQFEDCHRSAFILDTRLGKAVCLDHRYWLCQGCGTEHNHADLNQVSDDDGYSLSCPRTSTILLAEVWGPVASWPEGTPLSDLCGQCWGKGRCQCLGAEIGGHERCLRCQGDRRCTFCGGTGLRAR